MIVKHNVPLCKVSWLSNSYNGTGYIKKLFYPETVAELVNLVKEINNNREKFLIIGHTSNIYFMPDYVCDNMISTKHLNNYIIKNEKLVCECGVKVSGLSREMVAQGYIGFEGLVDLPGTIGGGLYGNAGCYDCHVAENLMKLEILTDDGTLKMISKEDMKYSVRSSALKRGEMKGVITRAFFNIEKGDKIALKKIATSNHENRMKTQPGPAHNLGSIYAHEEPTLLFYCIRALSHIYGLLLKCFGKKNVNVARLHFEYKVLGGVN